MAWALEDSDGNAGLTLTFAGTPADNEEIYLAINVDDSTLTNVTAPSGFSLIHSILVSNRTIGLYHKTASSEASGTYTFTYSGGGDSETVGAVFSGESHSSVSGTTSAQATNASSIQPGSITGASGSLMLFVAFWEGADTLSSSVTGATEIVNSGDATQNIVISWKQSTGTADNPTHTLTSSVLRQSAIFAEIVPTAVSATIAGGINRGLINNGLINGGLTRM